MIKLSKIPILAKVKTSDVPPNEISGSGMPVIGSIPVTAPILITAWLIIIAPMPPPSNRAKRSSQRRTATMITSARAKKTRTTAKVPGNPSSSPITAKMKSVYGAGR